MQCNFNMDGKQESQTSVKVQADEIVEEPITNITTLSTSNPDEDINNVNSPPTGATGATGASVGSKVTKKKNKSKARNAMGSNDLDTDLKKLTQRRINVAGAPKMPLNAYVRFMNDRREQLRREHPQRTALEHTKMIGEEWHLLTEDRRAPYMEAASKEKALYQEQMHKFLMEHPEIVANELAKCKKVFDSKISKEKEKDKAINIINSDTTSSSFVPKKSNVKTPVAKQPSAPTPDPDDIPLAHVKRTPTPPAPPPQSFGGTCANAIAIPRTFAAGEIPIYTNEFIEHNRSTENELRLLRKTKTDLEQQNSVLEQHVDNTKAGHAKVMAEVTELKEENARLTVYIKGLRQKLVKALDGVSLPSLDPSGLSVDNVDKHIHHLASMISNSSVGGQQNNGMLIKVADILGKIDASGLQKS